MARGEGTKKLSDLFLKYQKTLKAPQGHVIEAFVEVVVDVLGITIKKEQVSYNTHTRVLFLKTGGAIKSEILLNKKEILNHLKGRLGEKNAPLNLI